MLMIRQKFLIVILILSYFKLEFTSIILLTTLVCADFKCLLVMVCWFSGELEFLLQLFACVISHLLLTSSLLKLFILLRLLSIFQVSLILRLLEDR